MEAIDFRHVNDVKGRTNCHTCTAAALKETTVRQLEHKLGLSKYNRKELPLNRIVDLYEKAGFKDVKVPFQGTLEEFSKFLNENLKPGEKVTYPLAFEYPQGGGHVVLARSWKDKFGRVNSMTTDFQKPSYQNRFSKKLPDAKKVHMIYSESIYGPTELNLANSINQESRLVKKFEELSLLGLKSPNPTDRNLKLGQKIDDFHKKQFEQIKEISNVKRRMAQNAINGVGFSGTFLGSFLDHTLSSISNNCMQKRVIAYVTSWSKRKFSLTQSLYLTNVIYAFIKMNDDASLVIPDTDEAYQRLMEIFSAKEDLQKEGLSLKISFAIGGWKNSEHFSKILSNSDSRIKLVENIKKILSEFSFDGVDIDWLAY